MLPFHEIVFFMFFFYKAGQSYVKSHTYLLVLLPVDQDIFETLFFLLIFNICLSFVTYDSKANPVKEIFTKACWSEFRVVNLSKSFVLIKYLKYLKLVSAIFYHIFIFHQMIALQKLKNVFISSKKLFLFLIEAVVPMCSVKKVFLEISQNSFY